MFALLPGNERLGWSRPLSEVARVSPVKPSAQPTQVRTLHLPPPAETARELGILASRGPCSFVPPGPVESRQIRPTPASPRTYSGQHPGTPGPFTGRFHRNRRGLRDRPEGLPVSDQRSSWPAKGPPELVGRVVSRARAGLRRASRGGT
jgi:hypothetical protein